MKWEIIAVEKEERGRTTPFASVGFGRLALNAAACKMIGDYEEYPYAELLKGTYNGKLCFGVMFHKESTPNSLLISRKKVDGKYISGITIDNKPVVQKMFGEKGIQKKTTRYNVIKDPDTEDTLIIIV